MKLSQIFEDADGKASNIRVMSFLSLIYLFFFTAYITAKEKALDFEVLVLFACMAFAPKVIQKFAEKKTGDKVGG